MKAVLNMQHHSHIIIPSWQNPLFDWSCLEVVLQMVLWLDDTSTKKQLLFAESLIMVSCGDDGRCWMNEENGAGGTPVLWDML